MADLTKEQLLETIDETVDWASDLGDQWVGTMIGRMLDAERDHLLEAVRREDLELASVMVLNLAMTCNHAEEQLKKAEDF